MKKFLEFSIFEYGNVDIKVINVAALLVFYLIFYFALKLIKKSIYKISKFDDAKKYSLFTLIKYFLWVISIVISINILGFNISVFLAGSAALLVGVGLGIQHLFSDYVSGIVLLLDSSVKVGDVLQINDLICKVEEIHLRTTKVITRDDKYIVLPNSELTRNNIINWTHSKISSRFDVKVGISYHSNIDVASEILRKITTESMGVLKQPAVFTRIEDFGASAIELGVYFWSDDVFRVENIKSKIRREIFEKFKENNIEIPYNQLVVHYPKL